MIPRNSIPLLALALMVSCSGNPEPWRDLIGKELSGWEQLNGIATYELVDGAIVGTTALNSSNSFLCTKEEFGDFILEYDVLCDPVMNSGVQVRSHSFQDYRRGAVHGYQVEIDPTERAWSGGIYDESRRLWLYPLDRNPGGKKAFVNAQWNHFRVEAFGNSIRTWCNSVPCADLVDDMTLSGFIGLQVHSIGNDSSKTGKRVTWKNIRIITSDVEKYLTPYEPIIPQNSYLTNRLSSREAEEGWQLLWDGLTADGWRSVNGDSFPVAGWSMEEGVLTTGGSGGDIITEGSFTNFELILDFMYHDGGNSGIKYFISGSYRTDPYFSIGCEYQILDDRLNPDAKLGREGNHRLAALYDLIPPSKPRDNGPGNWNRARIVVNGNHVEHWLNNQMTLQYERGTEQWRELVAGSKYRNYPGFGEAREGHIMLQEHGHLVSFKNIKLKEL